MNGYEDILNLPHYNSRKHPRMSAANRAAQFSPFAALTGYEAAIRETARQTGRKIELCEDEQAELSEKLRRLQELDHPTATFIYFVPDGRKEGGEYVTRTAQVKRIDAFHQVVGLSDGQQIPIGALLDVDCEEWT